MVDLRETDPAIWPPSPPGERRRVLITAFKGAPRALALAEATARAFGEGAATRVVEGPNDLDDAPAYDVVAAAGGDGAARRVAGAILGRGPAFAVLPAGSANRLAAALGVRGRDPARLAELLARGAPRTIPLGWANSEPFLVAAGAGLDGEAAAAVGEKLKAQAGLAAYALAILSALQAPAPRLVVHIGEARLPAAWAMALSEHGPDGRMRLALFAPASRAFRSAQIAALAAGRLSAAPGVRLIPFRTAWIEAEGAALAHVDGEAMGKTPLALSVDPRPLIAVTPAAAA